jgi:hypothetical protein
MKYERENIVMKKTLAWILVLTTLLLAGCQQVADPTDPTNGPGLSAGPTNPKPTGPKPTKPAPTESQPTEPMPTEPMPTEPTPTEPTPTEPTVPVGPDGFPADLNTDADVVAKFQKLFDNDSWYTQALLTKFDNPRNIGLNDFLFCDMKPWPYKKLTADEREELCQQLGVTEEWWVDCYSMEAATVEEVLQRVFGLSFVDFTNSAKQVIRYLKSTDCYYYGRTDSSLVWNVSVVGTRKLENGNIEVYYSCDWLYPEAGVVTLQPYGEGYHIVSNTECHNQG